MNAKLLFCFVLLLVLSLSSLPLTHTVYGQTTAMKLSTKGPVAESSNFHGAILWTVINGNDGIIIVQSPAGRGLAHISVTPSTNCSSPTAICLLSTVTDAGQIGVFKVGDTTRISIDVNSNQETASILTGTLAGFDVSISLSKIWNKTVAPVTPTTLVAPTAPVNSTTTQANTSTNSTATPASPKHFSADLAESFHMASH